MQFIKFLENKKIKNNLIILLLSVGIFFLNAKTLIAESIKNYNVTIQINKNGTLTVNEIIDYDFDVLKHGIYRDIPLKSQKNGVDIYKSRIKMHSIKRNGEPEKYETERLAGGISYRVGSADRYVDVGINRYEFNYTIYNSVFEKDGIYQIYFNPIGQFWGVPIEKANVDIKFADAKSIEKNEIQKLEVYTGSFGKNEENYNIIQDSGIIKIETKEVLGPYNGMTFLLNLKTDKISPTFIDKLITLYYAEPLIIIGTLIILVLAVYGFITWYLFGKDPSQKAVIPEFNPPKDISPMYAAYINKEREPKELLIVGMLSLLSKGYVEAEDEEGNGKNVKYTLIKSIAEPNLPREELKLLNALSDDKENIFKDGKRLYLAAQEIISLLESRYGDKIYKENNAFKFPFTLGIITSFIISMGGLEIGLVIIFILNTICSIISSIIRKIFKISSMSMTVVIGIIVIIASTIFGIINFIVVTIIVSMFLFYSKVIGKYTNEGIRQKEYLDGMKMYIKTAEANQIMKFNDVDELVAYFKSILPYAVALGVKNEAVKLMKNTIKLYNFDESTYSNINRRIYYSSYNDFYLSNMISREYNEAQNKIIRERNESARSSDNTFFGGGGFSSGGGFSGGGSGGGGGGSW